MREKTITYLPQIEDLFFIWKKTEEEPLSFMEDLNKNTRQLNSIVRTQKQR